MELVKVLIRHGEKIVCYLEAENNEKTPISVTDYITTDLKQDNLEFQNPLHRKLLTEAGNHQHDTGFTSEKYFLTHPDAALNKLAAEMLNEKYQLSKSNEQALIKDEERLHELIPHLLIDFKLSILEEDMKQTVQKLSLPEVAENKKLCMEVMEHYKNLTEALKEMAKRAGDRVIMKV